MTLGAFREPVDNSRNAALEEGFSEVQQVAKFHACELQVSEQLLPVRIVDRWFSSILGVLCALARGYSLSTQLISMSPPVLWLFFR